MALATKQSALVGIVQTVAWGSNDDHEGDKTWYSGCLSTRANKEKT